MIVESCALVFIVGTSGVDHGGGSGGESLWISAGDNNVICPPFSDYIINFVTDPHLAPAQTIPRPHFSNQIYFTGTHTASLPVWGRPHII